MEGRRKGVWSGSGAYWWTFGGLLALTALTLGLSFVDLAGWGAPLALVIGAAKALLVLLFFMHLAEHRTSSRIAFTTAVAFAAILIGLTVLDVGTRERDRYAPPGPDEEAERRDPPAGARLP